MSELYAISPLDGRYISKLRDLSPIFSEAGLISYRYIFEIKYLNFLLKILKMSVSHISLPTELSGSEILKIKSIEKETNHDVKAVEIYIKNILKEKEETKHLQNYVHFGLTSQDVNTTAYTLQLKIFTQNLFVPKINTIIEKLQNLISTKTPLPMLCFTHGQPATPSTFQKQIQVYITRLYNQIEQINRYKYRTKLGGATGGLNAHKISFPSYKWEYLLTEFLKTEFNIERLKDTTQISHYDDYSELFAIYQRINTILIDLTQDFWKYISLNYLIQTTKTTEIGSSTMPHKVNPIDFENAEGNLQLSNNLLQHLQAKLPVSRLQRDLTDSTTLRNIGTACGHLFLALQSLQHGLQKVYPNEQKMLKDLNDHPEILAEAYQTILRTLQPPLKQDPYDLLKHYTRGKTITLELLREFLLSLESDVPKRMLEYLLILTPVQYALAI